MHDLEKLFKQYRFYGMSANSGNILANNELLLAAKKFMEWEIKEREEKN